jgi:hypothetical protein
MLIRFLAFVVAVISVACGPTSQGDTCAGGTCTGPCNPGDTHACYSGQMGTENVGPCHGGTQTCGSTGMWEACQGQVVPSGEICGDGIDNNCNGMIDEDVDMDGDGWTTCQGDCCDSTECSNPALVNPGAFDIPGDGVDNDCDGMIDNAPLVCDQGLASNSTNAMDLAKAIDLCQTTTMADPMRRWGVIDASLTLADGNGSPNMKSKAILPHYGTNVTPHNGSNLMLISSGNAAGTGDPNYDASLDANMNTSSGFPADFLAANNNTLPNAPNCPPPKGTTANDPMMLTLHVRVPTNVQSFSLDTNFFSDEFPEWTCSAFNDFFVVLLDSMYSGTPPNPTDKNLAFYASGNNKYPVGVNLAAGNTGLFTQCVNGATGCESVLMGGTAGTISTCTSTTELTGTGMEQAAPFSCDTGSVMGGGTGWLTTTGNVKPGEIMTLRIAIWDTSDHALDSLAVIDNFKWSGTPSTPGTVIERTH